MQIDKHQRHLRIIYTRVLERGISKCVSYLSKEENSDKGKFIDFIESIKKPILKAQKVPLGNDYYKGIEELMYSILNLPNTEFDLDESKNDILRSANGLQKLKRKKNSKKPKHKKMKFDDGN